jgi:flavin prenyltransferase
MSKPVRRIVLAITGASGSILGIRTLELLKAVGVETHLVISTAARQTIQIETGWKVEAVEGLAHSNYDPGDISAPIASGSFVTEGMLIVPCSIKSLSAVANSYSSDVISRAADVCLKEGRKLILAVRETPLHPGHLRLMQQAASAGAVIFPPVPSFYAGHKTLDEMYTDLAGRILLRMGIDNDAYSPWVGSATSGSDQGGS